MAGFEGRRNSLQSTASSEPIIFAGQDTNNQVAVSGYAQAQIAELRFLLQDQHPVNDACKDTGRPALVFEVE